MSGFIACLFMISSVYIRSSTISDKWEKDPRSQVLGYKVM